MLGGGDQLAVLQLGPAALVGAFDRVFRKCPAQGQGRTLVEEDFHLRRG